MTTETKVGHTPGPWEVPGTDGGEWVVCHKDKAGKRRTLAHVYSEADARLIMLACNSHYDLLAALKQALFVMESVASTHGYDTTIGAVPQARAAIAKATGG